ncbi:MAG: hypothetical protein R3326_06365 [Gemmatimonadota bacterium]|nr:hypothetical protein [Gemmatimonadota bacterium]
MSFVVYDIESAESSGGTVAVGAPDDLPRFVDSLATAILAKLPDRERARPRGLARTTSREPAALEAYLVGESHLAGGRLENALGAYRRAVAADSTFALAHLRISEIAAWVNPDDDVLAPARHAVRWKRRLAPRESALAEARLALARTRPEGLKALRQAARRWPDDPDAWQLLGETLFRLGPFATAVPREIERALILSAERAPGFAPAWVHRIDFAIAQLEPSRAGALLDTLEMIAPAAWFTHDRRLRTTLAFGAPIEREMALHEIESSRPGALAAALETLWHPRQLERQREVLSGVRSDRSMAVTALAWNLARAGRIGRALEILEEPDVGSTWHIAVLFALRSRDLPVIEERVDAVSRDIREAEIDDDELELLSTALFFSGAWAVHRGDLETRRWALARLRRASRHAFENADSLSARVAVASVRALEGLVHWVEEGDRREAVRRFEGALHDTEGRGEPLLVNAQIRWWLAELHEENDDLHQALVYYRSFWDDPFARAESGVLHAAIGDTASARDDYRLALSAWDDPDPELVPRVREVRNALDRLDPLATAR